MRKLTFRLSLIVGAALALSCGKKEDTTAPGADDWPEMDSFHMIMAESYHPLKDSANLLPARTNAEAMASEVEKWVGAVLPEKVNTEDIKTKLAQLKADTRAFADNVKANAPDTVLSASLEKLHEEFHQIMEAWNRGAEEHEHH